MQDSVLTRNRQATSAILSTLSAGRTQDPRLWILFSSLRLLMMASAHKLLIATLLVAICLLSAYVDANSHAPKAEYVMMESSEKSDPASLRRVLEYWTDERINDAMAHPVFSHGHNSETPEQVDWEQVTRAVQTRNSAWRQQGPLKIADSLKDALVDVDNSAFAWRDSCGFPLGTSAVPYSSYNVFPFAVIGWLVTHDPRLDVRYACSASLVGGVLATAGHCVGGAGYFYDNALFMPQRTGENFPFGKWPVTGLKAYSCWILQGMWECDYAFAKVQPQLSISYVSGNGTLGIAANVHGQGTYMACGYPNADRFNGSMWCTRNAADKVTSCCKRMPSKMVSGASGGPWIIGCQPGMPTNPASQTNFVNGVISHKKSENSLDLWSPRFTALTYQLFQAVNGTTLAL